MEKIAKRLCFGTFASVLALCKSDDVSNALLVGTIVRTVDPESDFAKPEHATTVTRLLKCERSFPNVQRQRETDETTNRLSNVPPCAREAKLEEVGKKFQESVLPLLDEDKKKLAVLALLNIIKEDEELDTSKQDSFKKHFGAAKSALLEQSVFVLHDFLARVFLYTVLAVTNDIGKPCIGSLDDEYIGGFCGDTGKIRLIDPSALTGPAAEQILGIFHAAIKKYRIVEYMNSDPSIALEGTLPYYADAFYNAVEEAIFIGLVESQKEKAYQKVYEFADTLARYQSYLAENLHPKTDVFALTGKEDSRYMADFKRNVDEYKQRIDSIYGEINNGNTLFVL